MNNEEFHRAFVSVGVNDKRPWRIGAEYSRVGIAGRRYLDRFIAYFGGTVRLHKFHRGDDDRAPHDHPWWFVTFPFVSYQERYWFQISEMSKEDQEYAYTDYGLGPNDWAQCVRVVKAWRFHYRPAKFRHIVLGRADGKDKPFWSLCITGHVRNLWGFWPQEDWFVPHKEGT